MSLAADKTGSVEDVYELSPMQVGMLLQSVLAPEAGAFFEQQVMRLRGGVQVDAFARAWERVMAATPVLRTSFHWDRIDKPVQVIHDRVRLPLEVLDWRSLTEADAERRLMEHLQDARRKGFHVDRAPLFRLELVRVGAGDETWFIWHFHHILMDGWSGQLLMRDIAGQYAGLLKGDPPASARRPPYSRYIDWLRRQDTGALEAFWRARLERLTGATPLGIGAPPRERASARPNEGETSLTISEEEVAALRDFARRNRLTLNTLAQGAWALLLARYGGGSDVSFGTVVSGRPPDLQGVESMIGLFINILPTLVDARGERRVLSWLRDLQAQQLETGPFQHIAMHQIREWSALSPEVEPFETVLVFENFPLASADDADALVDPPLYVGRTNVPVTVLIAPGPTMVLKFLFDKRRFDAAAIARAARHLRNLLGAMTGMPEARIRDLPMLDPDEVRRAVFGPNATAHEGYDAVPLMTQLARQAARTPDATAFIDGSRRTSVSDVDQRSTAIANGLLTHGVRRGDVVAVGLPRSLDAVMAFLAVLKARACYLPLDPDYPAERLSLMVEDAAPAFLLAGNYMLPEFRDLPRADCDALIAAGGEAAATKPLSPAAPDDLAYLIYTSGSTGRPKGVAASHRQILNRLDWIWRSYPWAPGETGIMRTALNFVDSFQEMLAGLLQGVPTVIARGDHARDPDAVVDLLAAHRVTRIWFVPSFLELLLDAVPDLSARLPHLTFWSSGGEPLSDALGRRFQVAFPHGTLYNTFGASEIWDATFFDPHRDTVGTSAGVPIGRPIANTRAYVLDCHGHPAAEGVAGELALAGACLAEGYLGHAADEAGRFGPATIAGVEESRLYRTGDLVVRRDDGVLEHVGRRDFQIKVSGYRVEPAEVEAALRRHPDVASAAVGVTETCTGRQLIGYVVANGRVPEAADVQAVARRTLPAFMVPSQILVLDELPRTPSGKVDRRRLPAVNSPAAQDVRAAVPPRTPLEATILARIQELTDRPKAGSHANFFGELGGHSLLAARLVSRLREDLGIDLPLRLVFEAPTAAALADRLAERLTAEGDPAAEILLTNLEMLDPETLELLIAELEEPGGLSP